MHGQPWGETVGGLLLKRRTVYLPSENYDPIKCESRKEKGGNDKLAEQAGGYHRLLEGWGAGGPKRGEEKMWKKMSPPKNEFKRGRGGKKMCKKVKRYLCRYYAI